MPEPRLNNSCQMTTRSQAQRSKEAPMDFQFTSRPSSNVKPVWATAQDNPSTQRKRDFNDLNPPTPAFPATPPTTFGSNNNVPFMFHTPPPKTRPVQDWVPPLNFTPSKAFPLTPTIVPEVKDVDMAEVSPPRTDDRENERGRVVATGGMRRVFKSRQKTRDVHGLVVRSRERSGGAGSGTDSEDDEGRAPSTPIQNSSTHYTLNMSTAPGQPSNMPYILLGYLQFFFNLCLILLFLYLTLQFILTVQRDVEQRISEYSMEIVQEIAMCSLQYKNNLCASNPIPAMGKQCSAWETCMQRDPTVVGRARVGAELIAEIVNSFVEPISWKTLVFTLTSLSFLTVFINALLSLYRSKHNPGISTPPLHPSFPVQPHQFGGYLSPAPTPTWNRAWNSVAQEEQQTPTRRRRLEGGGSIKVK